MNYSGGRSVAEGKRERQRLLRELKATADRDYRARIAALKRKEGELRSERKERIAAIRKHCYARFALAKARADEEYRASVRAAAAKRRARKKSAKSLCAGDRAAVRTAAREGIASARRSRAEERALRRQLAADARRASARSKSRATGGERLRESDDAVLAEIPDHLVPLWKRVRKSIKAGPRSSRTEAFLKYAEENPREVYEAQERAAARDYAREQREYWASRKAG